MLPLQQFIGAGLADDRFKQAVQRLPLPVIGGRYVADTVFPEQPLHLLPAGCRIVYPNRMATIGVDQFHTGNVGVAVPEINHIAEGYTDFVLREKLVDPMVVDIQHPFFDTEEKLGLTCIVDRLRRPFGRSAVVEIKAAGKSDAEEIEQEIRKQFKMKGLILADIDIAKKMDTTLAKGNSNIIPAYIDKEGNLSNRSSNISRSQFENLQKYTQILIKKIANEILSGNIELKPYYKVNTGKTPCEYCDYRSICNFNSGLCKNSYQYIPNFNKEYLLEKINKEVDTNNIE